MKKAASGCVGWFLGAIFWLMCSTFIASFFGLGEDATVTLSWWIFLGGPVLYLIGKFVPRGASNVKMQGNNSKIEMNPKQKHFFGSRETFTSIPVGCVYLLKAGPFYKIGKSQNFEKRLSQIKLQLPYPVEVIHVFRTGSMSELETYWHRRFREKRTNGEWFILTDEDVGEFVRQS